MIFIKSYGASEKIEEDIFPIGMLKFIGKTGVRYIHGQMYEYLGDGYIVDKDAEVSKPSGPNYLQDNFISITQQRDNLLNILDERC